MKVCESETYEFPYCFKYKQLYRVFCEIFELGEKREKIEVLKDGIIIEIRNKEMVIMSRIFMLVIKERMFRFH